MAKTIVFCILVALVIIFVLQNTQVVEFQFFAWKVSMSRALLLLGNFLIGFVAGWLSSRLRPKARKAK
ncbi:lipopolysaccharide assembly protein LapA domain-containing protein [Thermodesulfobacteriota bacterium]